MYYVLQHDKEFKLTKQAKIVHHAFSKEELEYATKVHKQLLKPIYFELLYKHPNKDGFYRWLYDTDNALIDYLKLLKGFHIKEISLHLYLAHPFIQENWEVYHIIRHPIDVLASLCSIIVKQNKLHKFLLLLVESHPKIKEILSKIRPINVDFHHIIRNAQLLLRVLRYNDYIPKTFFECFVYTWVVTNYMAIISLPKDKIIIYNKPNTLKRLPITLFDKFKVKYYPKARELLQYKFENIVHKLELEYEYNFVMKYVQ